MQNILEYTDFRQFIRDFYEENKKQSRSFSLRVFADKAGFSSKDYILRVMNGQRNLSKSSIFKLCKAMELKTKEMEFFENMVAYGQAKTQGEKDFFLKKIQGSRASGRYELVSRDRLEFYSRWYHGALRSLLPVMDFRNDYKKIGAFLKPRLTESQVKDSVERLLRMGFLSQDKKGAFHVSSSAVSSGAPSWDIPLAAYHEEILDLAKSAIRDTPINQRDVSGVTFSISEKGYNEVRNEMNHFRKKVIEIAAQDSGEDRVCQLALQLFPLSKIRK